MQFCEDVKPYTSTTDISSVVSSIIVELLAERVEEYGQLVVARSSEPKSKIRVQLLADFLYRREKLSESISLDAIDILFVPAILEDPDLNATRLSFDKATLFLMMANYRTKQIFCFCPNTTKALINSLTQMEILRNYLGNFERLMRSESILSACYAKPAEWRPVYPSRTPLLDEPSLDPRVAICELMERLSLDPYPDLSPEVLVYRNCNSETLAVAARIARELRLHKLERPARSDAPASPPPKQTLLPAGTHTNTTSSSSSSSSAHFGTITSKLPNALIPMPIVLSATSASDISHEHLLHNNCVPFPSDAPSAQNTCKSESESESQGIDSQTGAPVIASPLVDHQLPSQSISTRPKSLLTVGTFSDRLTGSPPFASHQLQADIKPSDFTHSTQMTSTIEADTRESNRFEAEYTPVTIIPKRPPPPTYSLLPSAPLVRPTILHVVAPVLRIPAPQQRRAPAALSKRVGRRAIFPSAVKRPLQFRSCSVRSDHSGDPNWMPPHTPATRPAPSNHFLVQSERIRQLKQFPQIPSIRPAYRAAVRCENMGRSNIIKSPINALFVGPEPMRKRVGRVEISVMVPDESTDGNGERRDEPSDRETTVEDVDSAVRSKSRAPVAGEPPVVRRSPRKRKRSTRLNSYSSCSSESESEACDEERGAASDEWQSGGDGDAGDASSPTSSDAESSRNEPNDGSDANVFVGSQSNEMPADNIDVGTSSNSGRGTSPLEEELAASGGSSISEFLGLLVDIRKQLTRYSTTPPQLLPPKRLIRLSGLLRIRTGNGVRGRPELLIQRVLQKERHPDVVSASSRAAHTLGLNASKKAAMDAFSLVCITTYIRVPLDFRALEPLFKCVWAAEGNCSRKSPGHRFTDGEKYRLLRLYLLLGAYDVSSGVGLLNIPPRVVFLGASTRNENCLPLKWLSGQLNREFTLHREPFLAFNNALSYLLSKLQHNRERQRVPEPTITAVTRLQRTPIAGAVRESGSGLCSRTAVTSACTELSLTGITKKDDR